MRPAFAPPAAGALWAINGDEDSTAPAPARRTDSINSRREGKGAWRSVSGLGESAESSLLCARTRSSPPRLLNRWPQRVFHTGYPRQVGWRAATELIPPPGFEASRGARFSASVTSILPTGQIVFGRVCGSLAVPLTWFRAEPNIRRQ